MYTVMRSHSIRAENTKSLVKRKSGCSDLVAFEAKTKGSISLKFPLFVFQAHSFFLEQQPILMFGLSYTGMVKQVKVMIITLEIKQYTHNKH